MKYEDGQPSIQTVIDHQDDWDIAGHLVWMGREGFVLAHTDEERASGKPLQQCRVHRALYALRTYYGEVGYFRADVVDGRLELSAVDAP